MTTNKQREIIRMQIAIDTPYVTISEFVVRSGQSKSAVERAIKNGQYLIRPKEDGSKSAVLINMVHMTMEAAAQAERALVQAKAQ